MTLQIIHSFLQSNVNLPQGFNQKAIRFLHWCLTFSKRLSSFAKEASDISCALLGKLNAPLTLRTETQEPVEVPKYARVLRGAIDPDIDKGASEQSEPKKRRKLEGHDSLDEVWKYKAVFGLPWTCEQFIKRACEAWHPAKANHAVPKDLKVALDKHMEWSEQTLVAYRTDWCRRWLKRAVELELDEKADLAKRLPHVRAATKNKRLLLTQEIMESIGYEDSGALDLLRRGSPLAGDIPKCAVFQELYEPCLVTLQQLQRESGKRNQAILAACHSSGDAEVDRQVLLETQEEVRLGWAVGPVQQVPEGCVISRRFPLVQRNKTRMIDDYPISGVNDTAAAHSKVDLHMVDTFAAVLGEFFRRCDEHGKASEIVAKTYDLKSASGKSQFSGSTFNSPTSVSRTVNWGGQRCTSCSFCLLEQHIYSVYSFLRLARLLYTVATGGFYLLTTNFYDDYISASLPGSVESSKNAMELIFMLTGWQFATDGKKSTMFDKVCKALGVEFDLSGSGERIWLSKTLSSAYGI